MSASNLIAGINSFNAARETKQKRKDAYAEAAQKQAGNEAFAAALGETPEGRTAIGRAGAVGVASGAVEGNTVFKELAGMGEEKLLSLLMRDSAISDDPLLRQATSEAIGAYRRINFDKSYWSTKGSETARQQVKAMYGDGDGSGGGGGKGKTVDYKFNTRPIVPVLKDAIANLNVVITELFPDKKLKFNPYESVKIQFERQTQGVDQPTRDKLWNSVNSQLETSVRSALSTDRFLSAPGAEGSRDYVVANMVTDLKNAGLAGVTKGGHVSDMGDGELLDYDGADYTTPYEKQKLISLQYATARPDTVRAPALASSKAPQVEVPSLEAEFSDIMAAPAKTLKKTGVDAVDRTAPNAGRVIKIAKDSADRKAADRADSIKIAKDSADRKAADRADSIKRVKTEISRLEKMGGAFAAKPLKAMKDQLKKLEASE